MKKRPEQLRRIGLVANPDKPRCRGAVRTAEALIRRSGRMALADATTAAAAGVKVETAPDVAALARRTDVLLVFGGDGTILRIAREASASDTPLLGVNVGGLGFLTAVPLRGLEQALQQLWRGDYVSDNRPLMEAAGTSANHPIHLPAVNDFVISRGPVSRLIELEVRVDGEVLTRYRCDGLIVSSPTGSTAYSLSAGGAIVSPEAEVFMLTPICPHTLSNRSVIVNLRSQLSVKVLSRKLETVLTADGQVHIHLDAGAVIEVSRSNRSVRLLRLGGSSFFRTLRQKLNWSGSTV